MITKTGFANEGLMRVARAEQSPRVRAFYDYVSGRYKWVYHDPMFPMQQDAYGNQFLNSDGPACEGVIMWEVGMWRAFFAGVRSGQLGLNPKRLFRPPHQSAVSPVQSVQKSAGAVM